jgi:hypothetical protein
MKTLLVKFRICAQIGPDDWEMKSIERLFPEEARLSEVNDWAIKNGGYNKGEGGYKRMCEIQLSEPE